MLPLSQLTMAVLISRVSVVCVSSTVLLDSPSGPSPFGCALVLLLLLNVMLDVDAESISNVPKKYTCHT